MVTVLRPFTKTGGGETVLQAAGERLMLDSNLSGAMVSGQVRITLLPQGVMVSCGCTTLTDEDGRLYTVPLPEPPPERVVPKIVLPDKMTPLGPLPSLPPVKECTAVKTSAIGVDGK